MAALRPAASAPTRETLKYRAQEYVRKRTKVAGKKGRKGKGEERPGSA